VPVVPLALPSVVPSFLYHNWKATVSIQTAYLVRIVQAPSTGAEERYGQRDVPTRSMKVRLEGLSRRQSAKLRYQLARVSDQINPVPIMPDVSRVTATSAAAGTTVFCDTTKRRFAPGARIAIVRDGTLEPAVVEFALVSTGAMLTTQLTVQSALANTFEPGDLVFPCMDVEPILESRARLLTDHYSTIDITFTEVPGPSALPPSADSPNVLYPVLADGRCVVRLPLDWGDPVDAGVVRVGERFLVNGESMVVPQATRPQHVHGLPLACLSRASAWDALNFHDAMRGSLRSFWSLDPQTLFKVVGSGTTYVDVEPIGNIQDVSAYTKYLALEKADGSVIVSAITGVAVNGVNWRISVFPNLPDPITPAVVRATQALLSRLEEDVFEELWTTNTVLRSQMNAVEMLTEAAAVMSNLADPNTFDLIIDNGSLLAGFDSSRNLFTGAATGDTTAPAVIDPLAGEIGDPVTYWGDYRQPPAAGVNFLAGHKAGGVDAPKVVLFKSPYLNGNRPALDHDSGGSAGERFYLRPVDLTFFSNIDGLTIFVVAMIAPGQTTGYFFRRRGVLQWRMTGVEIFEDYNVVDATKYFSYSDQGNSVVPRVHVLTWKPSTYCRVYNHGTLVGSASSQVTDLPTASSTMDELAAAETTRICDFDKVAGARSWSDCILIYPRALINTEINAVGTKLVGMFKLSNQWVAVPP